MVEAHDLGRNRKRGGRSPLAETNFWSQNCYPHMGAHGCVWDKYDQPKDLAAEKAAKGDCGCSVCNLSLPLPWFFLKNRDVRQDCKTVQISPFQPLEGCQNYWGVIRGHPAVDCPFDFPSPPGMLIPPLSYGGFHKPGYPKMVSL